MVRVDAPWEVSPADWLATNARATPLMSTPWCSKNRVSSAATMACCITVATSASLTSRRFSS
jgi:hypothetical protein